MFSTDFDVSAFKFTYMKVSIDCFFIYFSDLFIKQNMNNKKPSSFIFIVCAIIIGAALYKEFNPHDFTFEKKSLSIVYFITLVFCIIIIIRNLRRK